jgi:hypothetical protein
VRPSQEWLVATLLDIQSKLDRLLGAPSSTARPDRQDLDLTVE